MSEREWGRIHTRLMLNSEIFELQHEGEEPAVVASLSLSMLLSSPDTVIARKAEHATEVIVRCERKGCQGRCLRNGKAAREFTVSHE